MALRAATRDAHDAAERVSVLAALADGTISRDRYAAMLAALLAMFDAWERRHAAFLSGEAAALGWRYVSRSTLLRRDLEDLGVDPRAGAMTLATHDASSASIWGMLYVVEGSTLGGRVLAGRVREAMPALAPTRYLEAGTSEPRYWPRFSAILDVALATGTALDAAIAGARSMFALYERTLENVR
jgi:heme oxygenase